MRENRLAEGLLNISWIYQSPLTDALLPQLSTLLSLSVGFTSGLRVTGGKLNQWFVREGISRGAFDKQEKGLQFSPTEPHDPKITL